MSQLFHLETIDGVSLVTFSGLTDLAEVRDEIYGLAENEEHTRVVLDFSGVEFLSSDSLGLLANLRKKLGVAGIQLRLCYLEPHLRDVLRVTHLDKVFAIYGSQHDALCDF